MNMTNNSKSSFKHIAVIYNQEVKSSEQEAKKIAEFIAARDVNVTYYALKECRKNIDLIAKDTDLCITLGGDGTVLRAGHICGPRNIPLLAINMGRFGFLIEVSRAAWPEKIDQCLQGEFWVENRMMIEVSLYRDEKFVDSWQCLNEAVIGRGKYVRPAHLQVSLDDREIATYVADGMIVSTPTGSTAYALAAGGPVLPPELRNFLLIPVAPHLSVDRAIILSEETKVSVKVTSDHDASLSVDGQNPYTLSQNDRVDIVSSKFSLKFVRFQENGYFYRNLMMLMDQNPSVGR